MAKADIADLARFYAKKYGRSQVEQGFEFLAIHTIAMEPEFVDDILKGVATEDVDLAEFHTGRTGDHQIDGILFDDGSSNVAIIQTTYASSSKRLDENKRNKIKSFFDQLPVWLDESRVDAMSNQKLRDLIYDSALGQSDQRIRLYFVISSSLENESDLFEHAERRAQEYSRPGLEVECILIDGAQLAKMHSDLKAAQSRSLVDTVTFNVSPDYMFIHNRTLVTAIKGNELANVYNRRDVGARLFNSNIRLALRETSTNKNIRNTTEGQEASNFFIYNNGVTATCSEFEYDGRGRVTAKNLQVVNGAQTVSALDHLTSTPNDKVYVLLRLIETEQFGKRKSETADKITRYQNTQNPIKLPDFKSNDPLQIWLRDNLSSRLSGKGANIDFWYCHKRGYDPANKPGIQVNAEELGKIRHAILWGPKVAYKEPKSIWDEANGSKVYWQAFGRDGNPCHQWNEEELAEVGWALRTRAEIRRIKKEMKKAEREGAGAPIELKFLESLAIYISWITVTGLRKSQALGEAPSFVELMSTKPTYEKYTLPLLTLARKVARDEVNNSASVNLRQELPSNEAANKRVAERIEQEVLSSKFN